MKKHIILATFVLTPLFSFAGGPWSPGKGKSYLQVGGGFIPSTNQLFYKGTETLLINRKVIDRSIGLFHEYGVNDRVTLVTSIPFNIVGTENTFDTLHILPLLQSGNLAGFGNVKLSGRYVFYNKALKISGGLILSLPTASSDESKGLRTGYKSLDVMPQVAFGYSKNKLYTYAELGYNVYRSNLSNNLLVNAEVGYKVYKEVHVALNYGMMLANFDIRNSTNPIEQTGLYSDGQEFAAFTLKVSTPVYKNIGINLSSTATNLFGNYVQRSPAYSASVYVKFSKIKKKKAKN